MNLEQLIEACDDALSNSPLDNEMRRAFKGLRAYAIQVRDLTTTEQETDDDE